MSIGQQHALQEDFFQITTAIQYAHDADPSAADPDEDTVRSDDQFPVLGDAQLSKFWRNPTPMGMKNERLDSGEDLVVGVKLRA